MLKKVQKLYFEIAYLAEKVKSSQTAKFCPIWSLVLQFQLLLFDGICVWL
jgi:hypothetical protein